MPAAVNSAFEVAFWFLDTALNHNEYLQPQKLQRLMYLAQSYYAALNSGRKLMPAVFVADELGPIEPNVHAALSNGRPQIETNLFLPEDVETVLKGVWRQFGHHSVEHLTRLTTATPAYRRAYKRSHRAEIDLASMMTTFARAEQVPSPQRIARSRVLRTQSGRKVAVRNWRPGEKAFN